MGDWSLVEGQPTKFVGSSQVTTGAANTYGGWSQQSAALPFDVGVIRCWPYLADPANYVIQYGIGSSGNEVGIVEIPCNQDNIISPTIEVPIFIPKGARLSVRAKCEAVNKDLWPDQLLIPIGSMLGNIPLQRATTYGLTGSTGVAVSTGATQNYGSWTEIVASTSHKTRQLVICPQGNTTTEVLMQAQLAVGAGGAEVVYLDQMYFYGIAGSKRVYPGSYTFPANIPVNARLSMRMIAPNLAGTYTENFSIIGLD